MSVPKGWIAPRRNVPCSGGCGRTLSRTSHFETAVCKPCNRKRQDAAKAPRTKRSLEQARRYRILIAASGYTFEQLLESFTFRRPRTREHRFDLTIEERSRAEVGS